MDDKTLNIFLTVVEQGSISKAASKLYYKRNTVSQAINELEEELGDTLFIRKANSLEQTEYCKIVYDRFKYLRFSLDKIEEVYKEEKKKRGFKVYACYLESLADIFIKTTEKFDSNGEKYSYVSCHSDKALHKLLNGECDISFFTFEKSQRSRVINVLEEHNCTYSKLLTTKPAIVISKNHYLADKPYVISSDLNAFSRIEHKYSQETVINHKIGMKKNGINTNPKLVISSMPDLISFIAKSDYYCLGLYIPPEKRYWENVSLKIKALEGTSCEMELVWACNKDYILTEESAYFIKTIEEYYRRVSNEIRTLNKSSNPI